MPPTFVELRAHTAFSFGDGALSPEQLIDSAAAAGYHTIGITDSADLGGVVRACVRSQDIGGPKVLVGAELRVDGQPLALLVRTRKGCQNLGALITRARVGALAGWKRGHRVARVRGQPSLTWSDLETYAEGLYCLTGPASGPLAAFVRARDPFGATRWLHRCRELFGGHVAVEVQDHRTGGSERALAGALIETARRAGMPWVVTNDPRYDNATSRVTHDILTALRARCTLAEAAERGVLHPNGEWRLLTPHEMAERWAGQEDGIAESERIAEACDFEVRWLRPPLPDFPAMFGHDQMGRLQELVYDGARARWGEISAKQDEQIQKELGIIGKLGFAGFFLVMWDTVRYAREERNIMCQGRGSAANSVVAYCLGVTAVDPVKHNLLFERFLSDVRLPGKSGEYTEAPDIDVDIEHDRREEVLDHLYEKYGRERSAIACIVQTYRAPNAVLDAMRALGYPVEIARMISKRAHRHDLGEEDIASLQNIMIKHGVSLDDTHGRVLVTALRGFHGLPRMRGTHVGGFVLSSKALGQYLPIEHTTMGRTIVQFDKDDLDTIGVPKFDFLGLGALSLVRHAFDAIEWRTHVRPQLYEFPDDDKPTYEMIARGETLGTFQIESRAQISSIVHTKPEEIYDIVVQVALVRPGPIQGEFVHPYTERRRGRETPVSPHPQLDSILNRTKGIPIFQEQAMAIAMELGRFSPGQADQLRRSMGNIRKKDKLNTVLSTLRQAMLDNEEAEPPVTPEVADKLVHDLQTFANYGFPESHAWSFALIAYVTAYLKRHHPAEFYLGVLNAQPMGFYQPSTLIHDARRSGVEVRPPCLARGEAACTIEMTDVPNRPALRIGWKHVRGISARTIERLETARHFAPFTSIVDIMERGQLARTDALQLARANAFAVWEPDRRRAAWEVLRIAGDTMPLAPARTVSYDPRPLDPREQIFADYHATGICVSGHPVEHLRPSLRAAGVTDSRALMHLADRTPVLVAGLVTVRQQPQTANGTIFLLLEDELGFVNIVVTRRMLQRYTDIVRYAPFVAVDGWIGRDDDAVNVIASRFRVLPVAERLTHEVHNFR